MWNYFNFLQPEINVNVFFILYLQVMELTVRDTD